VEGKKRIGREIGARSGGQRGGGGRGSFGEQSSVWEHERIGRCCQTRERSMPGGRAQRSGRVTQYSDRTSSQDERKVRINEGTHKRNRGALEGWRKAHRRDVSLIVRKIRGVRGENKDREKGWLTSGSRARFPSAMGKNEIPTIFSPVCAGRGAKVPRAEKVRETLWKAAERARETRFTRGRPITKKSTLGV